jgi:hypothetical protein
MPGTRKDEAPIAVDIPEMEGRYVDLGGYTVGYETFKVDMDPAPFFRGLPEDRCQSPHWGIVVKGRLTFRYADHEETFTSGAAYYAPPGHTPLMASDTQVIEFSPSDALQATMSVVEANLAAAAASA